MCLCAFIRSLHEEEEDRSMRRRRQVARRMEGLGGRGDDSDDRWEPSEAQANCLDSPALAVDAMISREKDVEVKGARAAVTRSPIFEVIK